LENLKKKIDKEPNSRKVEYHRYHARREETRNVRHSRSASKNQHHSPRHSIVRSHDFSGAENSPILSHVKHYKRNNRVDELHGEMRKIKPPTFYGENKKYEDAKAWLLGMRKYFQLHNYSSHAEARVAI
jgi:hypothetical protein